MSHLFPYSLILRTRTSRLFLSSLGSSSTFTGCKPASSYSTSTFSPPINDSLQRRTTTLSSSPSKSKRNLSWTEYFLERKKRLTRTRIFNVVGIPTAFVGGTGIYAHNVVLDPTDMIFGIEAPLAYTLAAIVMGIVSGMVTPMLLEGIWRFLRRSKYQEIDKMDKEFYQRIQKYRADPSLSLVGNQVYDFYGEKITSLSAYRKWLKKQRQLNKKATIKL